MDLPLFPLHTVLCPGVALPLHVFEDRYREMIRRCLADRTPFGVVLIRNGREVGEVSEPVELALAMIGTEAEIREASRYSDGRFDLVAVGTRRFALDDVVVGREPFLVGRVTPLEDPVGDPDRARALVTHVSRRFVRYLELLRPADGERAEELDIRVEVDVEAPDPAGGSTRGAGDGPSVEPDAAPRARRAKVPDNPATLSYLLGSRAHAARPTPQALRARPATRRDAPQLTGSGWFDTVDATPRNGDCISRTICITAVHGPRPIRLERGADHARSCPV